MNATDDRQTDRQTNGRQHIADVEQELMFAKNPRVQIS